jgi:predicted Zn finger-like uncharacterized protein
MNLATRCTECGTVFRVVPDQLKVSEGWVRCGRCSAVFNAQEQLFDLDAPPTPAVEPAPVPDAQGSPPSPSHDEAQAVDRTPTAVDRATGGSVDEPAPPGNDFEAPAEQGLPQAAARQDEWADDGGATRVTIGVAAVAAGGAAVRLDADETYVTPSFMKPASQKGIWEQPAMRGALVGLSLVLALAWLVQAAIVWRDELATRVPMALPALTALCGALGCEVGAPRRIEQLSVDASGLNRIDGAPLHRLTVTLRSRAEVALLMPAVELTLTDAQGKLIARRVIEAVELGATQPTIEAGAELPLQALLSTGDRRIAGYTVELFYP